MKDAKLTAADQAEADQTNYAYAQSAALAAYNAANATLMFFDETAPDEIVNAAHLAKDKAWEVYDKLIALTGVYP